MSCPTIKLRISKGYDNNGGGLNPVYTYYSDASVEVINGNSTAPIQGTLELTKYDNSKITYSISNSNNSFTNAVFFIQASDFYDYYLSKFTIILNDGDCIYEKIIDNTDRDQFPCETIISGIGGAAGDPSVREDCFKQFILSPINGCTNPLALNYDPNATIDDGTCIFVSGCTNELADNYNPNAVIDDGSCIIYGCTDPSALNYNPLATIDNGECVYVSSPVILGCTNPLASNYNPNATFNDGSCIFLSGCTNELADNYNPNATIDDGSCECNKADILFKLNGQDTFYFLNSGDTNCDYYLEFDYRLVLDCTSILDYFESKTNLTILQLLDNLKIYSEVRDDNSFFRQIELDINKNDEFYYFELSGNTEDCYTLKSLIAEELGEKCPDDINDKFKVEWRRARLKIPFAFLNKNVKIGLFLENFVFGGSNVLLDNIKLYNICFNELSECIIVPYNFGFDLHHIEDNKKSKYNIDIDKSILNTKELTLKIDVPNYIFKDVVSFLNFYEKILHKIFKNLTEEKVKKQFTPVRNVLTSKEYCYLKHLYEMYLQSFKYCNAKSKKLDYNLLFEVFNRVDKFWNELIKQFLPETAIWKDHNVFYNNLIFHQQKFHYKKYFLIDGTNDNRISYSCNLKTVNECSNESPVFTYKIDDFYNENLSECLYLPQPSPTNFSETNYGGGKLIQYDKTSKDIIKRHDYPNQIYDICP